MSISLRPAGISDVPLLMRWDEEPHVIDSDPNDEWDWETELARTPDWRQQLIIESEGHPIGVIQIIDPAREDTHYWGDVPLGLRAIDIWIGEASRLGKGNGAQAMRLALEMCFAEPEVEAVLIDPLETNTRAIQFYERLGFSPVERRRFGVDDCLVMRIDRPNFGSTRSNI
jgi:aminoglycoside 6'-N-acetyltransferase